MIDQGEDIKIKIDLLSRDIYNYAGCEFNISSTQQLGDILFEKLGLPHGKKGKTGYSTASDVLEKLIDKHPIISLIMEYRLLTKLYSTYIEGLINSIFYNYELCRMNEGRSLLCGNNDNIRKKLKSSRLINYVYEISDELTAIKVLNSRWNMDIETLIKDNERLIYSIAYYGYSK